MVPPPNCIPHWVPVAVVVEVVWIATTHASVYTPDVVEVPTKIPWVTLHLWVYLGWWILYNSGVLPIPGSLLPHPPTSHFLPHMVSSFAGSPATINLTTWVW